MARLTGRHDRLRAGRVSLIAALALTVAGCGALDGLAGSDDSIPVAGTDPIGTETPLPTGQPGDDGLCRGSGTDAVGQVDETTLTELSGLAIGSTEGVVWAHNDSGSDAGIAAFDLTGSDLGFHRLVGVDAWDPEDMAAVDGTVVLADIGDNRANREGVRLYLFAEPTPGADSEIDRHATVEAVYPDGATDAEAMLVDPLTGSVIVLAKNEQGVAAPTRLYTAPLPSLGTALDAVDRGGPIRLTLKAAGTIDLVAIEGEAGGFSPAALIYPGAATGADISADGSVIVIRTYLGVWAFPRSTGMSVIEALAGQPCLVGRPPELQGEAVAVLAGGAGRPVEVLTVGEGDGRTLHISGR